MSSANVTIEWLVPKWSGIKEEISVNRVKTKGPLIPGKQVRVSYKSSLYKAKIVDIGRGKFFRLFCITRFLSKILSSYLGWHGR